MFNPISNLSQFGWYEWGYYREASNRFPYPKDVLCRVLGPSTGSGNEMSQWALKANGQTVPRRSIRPLTPQEMQRDSVKKQCEIFDALIKKRWGDSITPPTKGACEDPTGDIEDPHPGDEDPPAPVPDNEDIVDNNGLLLNQQPMHD